MPWTRSNQRSQAGVEGGMVTTDRRHSLLHRVYHIHPGRSWCCDTSHHITSHSITLHSLARQSVVWIHPPTNQPTMDVAVADEDPDWNTEFPSSNNLTKSALQLELYGDVDGNGNGTNGHHYQKQGHVCCRCCCDTRRAVLTVNVLQFLMCLGASVLLLVAQEWVAWTASRIPRLNDDALQQDEQALQEMPVGQLLALWISQMVLAVCGVWGALQFQPPWVRLSSLSYVIGLIVAIRYGHGWGVSAVWNVLCFYPHVVFLQEVKRHIMTPENYPNEVYSCCGCASGNSSTATKDDSSTNSHVRHHRVPASPITEMV